MKISIMMLNYRLIWTLWILSCFGQYLCQNLQIPEANGVLGGSVVLAPDNPPSTPIILTQWQFGIITIITATSAGDPIIFPAYKDRVSLDTDTFALTLMNLRQDDSGTYRLALNPAAGGTLTGTTSLQVFVKVSDVKLIGPDKPLNEGDSANITSEGNGSNITVQWMKDNSHLSPSNNIIFSPDNRSVSISPVNISDRGEYQCTYSNPVSSETAKLRLTVYSGGEGGGGGGAGGLTTGAIVGIVIGVVVAVAGICGLIVYLIKTKKIPKPSLRQNGQASGAAQSREEPDMNYADVSHFQRASGERVILGDRSEPSPDYAEVKHGAKSKAPPRP